MTGMQQATDITRTLTLSRQRGFSRVEAINALGKLPRRYHPVIDESRDSIIAIVRDNQGNAVTTVEFGEPRGSFGGDTAYGTLTVGEPGRPDVHARHVYRALKGYLGGSR